MGGGAMTTAELDALETPAFNRLLEFTAAEFLTTADLILLLDRLLARAILTHAHPERVVEGLGIATEHVRQLVLRNMPIGPLLEGSRA
jgi:hypothetical protein